MPASKKLSKYDPLILENAKEARQRLLAGEPEVILATGPLRAIKGFRFKHYYYAAALEASDRPEDASVINGLIYTIRGSDAEAQLIATFPTAGLHLPLAEERLRRQAEQSLARLNNPQPDSVDSWNPLTGAIIGNLSDEADAKLIKEGMVLDNIKKGDKK